MKVLEDKIIFITAINSKTLTLRPLAYDEWDKAEKDEFDTMEM